MRIMNDNPQSQVCSAPPVSRQRFPYRASIALILAFLGSLLIIWLIQNGAGAFQAGFGGFPDEPAHYVAGLLVRDYLPHLFRESPMGFVQDYHARLPYFALGVWPPLFYCIEGAWMLLFGVHRSSALWLVAFSGAGVATILYAALKKRFGLWMAAAGTVCFLLVPAVQWSNCLVLADMTCSLFAFATVLFFARYYDKQKWQDALWMGLFGGLSLLTKNSTYFVLLVPPLVIFGTASWSFLRKPALWLGGLLSILIYAPWLYISRSVLLLGIHGLELPGFWGIQRHYASVLWTQTSFLFPLAIVGAASVMLVMLRTGRKELGGLAVSMIALLPACSIGIFLAKVPVQPRLLILPYAAIVFLAAELFFSLLRKSNRAAAAMTVSLIAFTAMNWMHFRYPPLNDMQPAVAFIQARDGSTPGSVLVPSAREGPWIAEFAQTESQRPRRIIVRPTKMLGEEDWNGSDWKPYYRSTDELQAFLERMPVKYCILSRSAERKYPHDELLRSMTVDKPNEWHQVYTHDSGGGRGYSVYENTRWTPEAEPLVYRETNRVVNQFLNTSH